MNAKFSMLVTLPGMITSVRFRLLNAPSPIAVTSIFTLTAAREEAST